MKDNDDAAIAGGDVTDVARARAEALVGKTIVGRFRVEELVAMGGIAAVFRATKLATREAVALKVLHPDAENLPELIKRFQREAIAGRHILHPNVAAVYETAQMGADGGDGGWFMVMEFIRGVTLREIMNRGPVPPVRAARIARQLAAALNASHDFGIIHRDVKPLNVMVLDGPDDRVKLIDFGLAKVPVDELALPSEDSRRSLTQAGVVFGTVAYMAPEAALGMRSVEKRSDLYALGVILYEMLAGKHPFPATDAYAMFAQHRSAAPPPIAERSPGIKVPAALEAIAQHLLAKDPDDRFPNARALIVALDAVLADLGSPSASAGPAPAGGGISALAIAGVVLVLAALAGVAAWMLGAIP